MATEQQAKYCRCLNHVSYKGSAYNVYAVCAKSTGTSYRHCTEDVYDFETMSYTDLQGYAMLHHLSPDSTREQILRSIADMMVIKGKPVPKSLKPYLVLG
jgi:hypothetical protein